jgi:hypothetical protein
MLADVLVCVVQMLPTCCMYPMPTSLHYLTRAVLRHYHELQACALSRRLLRARQTWLPCDAYLCAYE